MEQLWWAPDLQRRSAYDAGAVYTAQMLPNLAVLSECRFFGGHLDPLKPDHDLKYSFAL